MEKILKVLLNRELKILILGFQMGLAIIGLTDSIIAERIVKNGLFWASTILVVLLILIPSIIKLFRQRN